jgi:hypothetical protein
MTDAKDWQYIFIIGAMKAGTTTVFDWLASHSHVVASISKEPHYFCENSVDKFSAASLDEVWPEVQDATVTTRLEASTGYSKYPFEPGVPAKIRQAGLHPKFIYIVRNPYDRIESHYNFMKRRSYFEQDIVDDHLINTSNYGLQLRKYLECFDLGDICIVDFRDLSSAPQAVYERVLEFVDLPYEALQDLTAKNVTKGTNRIALWLMNSPLKNLLRKMPRGLIDPLKKVANRWLPVRETQRKLTDAERLEVKDRLSQDMRYFAEKTGFDVSQWGF